MAADGALVEVGEMLLMKALRLGREQTGTQVVVRCGIDRGRLSILERGLDRPRQHERERLARALKVLPDQVDQRVKLFVQMPSPTAQQVRSRRVPARSEAVSVGE